MTTDEQLQAVSLDQKAIEVLVANIIPTSKYFESRFDNMQYQVNELKIDIRDVKEDIKSLESRMDGIDKIMERIDRRIDDGLRENRFFSMNLFTFAFVFSAISMFGMLGRMFKLF